VYIDRWWDIVRLRLRSLLRSGRLEQELDKELCFHLESETEANLRLGLAPLDAQHAALRRLGGVAQIQEECRDMRRAGYFENFVRDLQYAIRTLARTPGFAAVIVLTLALSIGANSAIFSVIDGVLLRPLPYPHPERLVRVFFTSRIYRRFPLNPFDLRDIRARNRSFGAIAGITRNDRQLSGAGRPERLISFSVTAGYFRVLGINPALGREFTTEDELPGRGAQVILSDRVWRTRFAADPAIVGRKITIGSEPFTVTGVMPPVSHPGNTYHPLADGDTVDVWTPFTFVGDGSRRSSHYIEVFARLKAGITVAQSQADMNLQVQQLGREHVEATRGWQPLVIPLYQELVGPSRPMLLVLLGAVGLVLLIACANAANLLLARASSRQREIAVRAALGAGRSRLVRQMLTESLLLAVVGGVLGAGVAVGGVRALTSLLPADFPRAAAIHLDASVFFFTGLVTLATGLLFGLAPAIQASRADLHQALRESGRGASAGSRQLWIRNALVVGEIALACVLLAGAGLMLRSFVNMLRDDPGFRAGRVVTAAISLPSATYKTPQDDLTFFDRLNRALIAMPGVRAAGVGSDLPWTGYDDNVSGFTIEGKVTPAGHPFHARFHTVTEQYFQALGIPLLRGRFFTPHDDMKSAPVILVNSLMARLDWPGEDVIGKRLTFDDNPKEGDWFTVVGVVADVKDRPNSAAAEPSIFWPLLQTPFDSNQMAVVVRAQGDPAQIGSQLRGAVARLDPELAVADLKEMDDVAGQSFSGPRFTLFLIVLFAALAVTLAAIGIYGVISYSVSRRTHEFGLRMALGARPGNVIRQVMMQGIRLALVGIAAGMLAALALGRLLWSLLYKVSPSDPATFAAVAFIAVLIAALACYIPARRATAADPIAALRAD
jgi:predicted permease